MWMVTSDRPPTNRSNTISRTKISQSTGLLENRLGHLSCPNGCCSRHQVEWVKANSPWQNHADGVAPARRRLLIDRRLRFATCQPPHTCPYHRFEGSQTLGDKDSNPDARI